MEQLLPYQVVGSDWLASQRYALLADDMGLGKSAQAIVAADQVGAHRVLVICPAVATANWIREFEKFSIYDRPSYLVANGKGVPPDDAKLVVCSYDLAVRLHSAGTWDKQSFDLVVLDESHFLTNIDAKRTKAVMGTRGIIRRGKRVWCLTGTPMKNNPSELWVVLFTFGRTKLPFMSFLIRYCDFAAGCGPQSGMMQIAGAKKAMWPELRELMQPIVLRRETADVMYDLPPIKFSDIVVQPMDIVLENHKDFYPYLMPEDRRDELFEKLDREARLLRMNAEAVSLDSANGLKMLEALAGSISTLRRYTGIQKVGPVAEMVNYELAMGYYDKIVLFGIHRDVIEGLRDRLLDHHPVTVYGKTPPEKKQRHVDRFQRDPACKVFIGNIQAAGTAITLTASHNVVFVEQEWVPAHNAQAAKRCHRIGQREIVNVRFISVVDSIDEKIANVLRRKTRDIVALFDSGEVTREA